MLRSFWLKLMLKHSSISKILSHFSVFLFFKDFIYLLLETGEGRKKERERDINVQEVHPSLASRTPPTGDLAQNPGMRPDWESNQWPFSSQTGSQSTEPHKPGPFSLFKWVLNIIIPPLHTFWISNFKVNLIIIYSQDLYSRLFSRSQKDLVSQGLQVTSTEGYVWAGRHVWTGLELRPVMWAWQGPDQSSAQRSTQWQQPFPHLLLATPLPLGRGLIKQSSQLCRLLVAHCWLHPSFEIQCTSLKT